MIYVINHDSLSWYFLFGLFKTRKRLTPNQIAFLVKKLQDTGIPMMFERKTMSAQDMLARYAVNAGERFEFFQLEKGCWSLTTTGQTYLETELCELDEYVEAVADFKKIRDFIPTELQVEPFFNALI